ncbi:hypothetical protein TRIUR3_01756 [Triticum urartu]|uniref:Uncharacterized protein n=1 Tax=Triticum urartu TaxID=4572 RepID=M8A2T7_TRIUA|nr:hypothetical protein TRIUR3_01756 [Triticum urartu]
MEAKTKQKQSSHRLHGRSLPSRYKTEGAEAAGQKLLTPLPLPLTASPNLTFPHTQTSTACSAVFFLLGTPVASCFLEPLSSSPKFLSLNHTSPRPQGVLGLPEKSHASRRQAAVPQGVPQGPRSRYLPLLATPASRRRFRPSLGRDRHMHARVPSQLQTYVHALPPLHATPSESHNIRASTAERIKLISYVQEDSPIIARSYFFTQTDVSNGSQMPGLTGTPHIQPKYGPDMRAPGRARHVGPGSRWPT